MSQKTIWTDERAPEKRYSTESNITHRTAVATNTVPDHLDKNGISKFHIQECKNRFTKLIQKNTSLRTSLGEDIKFTKCYHDPAIDRNSLFFILMPQKEIKSFDKTIFNDLEQLLVGCSVSFDINKSSSSSSSADEGSYYYLIKVPLDSDWFKQESSDMTNEIIVSRVKSVNGVINYKQKILDIFAVIIYWLLVLTIVACIYYWISGERLSPYNPIPDSWQQKIKTWFHNNIIAELPTATTQPTPTKIKF